MAVKRTQEWDQEELEELVKAKLAEEGQKLADVENPIRWKFRPKVRLIIQSVPDDTIASDPAVGQRRAARRGRVAVPVPPRLDPSMFPAGARLDDMVAALSESPEGSEEAEEEERTRSHEEVDEGSDESGEDPGTGMRVSFERPSRRKGEVGR